MEIPGQLALSTSEDERIHSVEIRRSPRRRRTIAAKVENGTLVVYVPASLSRAEEAEWVDKMRQRFEARRRRRSLNEHGDLKRRADELNRRFFGGQLKWQSIEYVTNQRERYGSCTFGEGTIRISDSIAAMPDWVRDYVIVHELAHLVVPDHSERFWRLVNRYRLAERARGFLIAKEME